MLENPFAKLSVISYIVPGSFAAHRRIFRGVSILYGGHFSRSVRTFCRDDVSQIVDTSFWEELAFRRSLAFKVAPEVVIYRLEEQLSLRRRASVKFSIVLRDRVEPSCLRTRDDWRCPRTRETVYDVISCISRSSVRPLPVWQTASVLGAV
ncbi:hypothetical protein TNCV_1613121 [Trichonephila clavipes]|nr:hypothetical protein TNCV_1613121 [Trichonephila clavipes]